MTMSSPKYSRLELAEDGASEPDMTVPAYSPQRASHEAPLEPPLTDAPTHTPQSFLPEPEFSDSPAPASAPNPVTVIWLGFIAYAITCATIAILVSSGRLQPLITLLLFMFFCLFSLAVFLFQALTPRAGTSRPRPEEEKVAMQVLGVVALLMWSLTFCTIVGSQRWAGKAKLAIEITTGALTAVAVIVIGIVKACMMCHAEERRRRNRRVEVEE